jgi:DNA-binding NarL/FixJ family response regulator
MFTKSPQKINQNIPITKEIIFIVEDNEVYAKSLQTFIQTRFPNIKGIKIFRIGEMCLMELHRNPSIVIMDYFLNSKYEEAENGLEIIKRIKAEKPETNIIVLSAQENFNVILEAIKEYDCNYVQKDKEAFSNIEQLIKAIFNRKKTTAFESGN